MDDVERAKEWLDELVLTETEKMQREWDAAWRRWFDSLEQSHAVLQNEYERMWGGK